ncbi:hypothetical protein [uncultured Croceitalea sp.]|uniref:hypothetical protein n=1 Tax=uncultured Croceitalea sp. TaxID=1798908 RepID=UPI00330580A6
MSEKTLDNLIKTLKVEAIEAAEKEAAIIREAAEKEAQDLLKNAQTERKQILDAAEEEARSTVEKGKSALRQAARDVNISLKNEIVQLLKSVLEDNVEKSITPGLLKTAMTKVVENIGSDIELKLTADLKEGLADYVQRELQISEEHITVFNETSLKKSLSITKKGKGWSYEVSSATVTELLGMHLNNEWTKLLKSDVRE